MYTCINKVIYVFAKAPYKTWFQVSRLDKQSNEATKETENVLTGKTNLKWLLLVTVSIDRHFERVSYLVNFQFTWTEVGSFIPIMSRIACGKI